jgi:ribosomal protein S9
MQILAKSVGRRKEAVAQVQITRGTGQFIINNKPAQDYLQNDSCSLLSVKAPFEILRVSTELAPASLPLLNAKGFRKGEGAGNNLPDQENSLLSPKEEQEVGIHSSIEAMEMLYPPKGGQTENALNALNIDTIVKVKGGGLMGQTEAIRLGIARAICLLSSGNQNGTVLLTPLGGERGEITATADSPLQGEKTEGSEPVATFLDVRKQLKDKGYLTQDSRVKERRKYGLKKARKASQYHKR